MRPICEGSKYCDPSSFYSSQSCNTPLKTAGSWAAQRTDGCAFNWDNGNGILVVRGLLLFAELCERTPPASSA